MAIVDRICKICSRECAGISKKPKITKVCVVCGTEYKTLQKQERRYGSKCCSFNCLIKHNASINTKHELNEKTRLSRGDWQKARLRALERDGYTCQHCGTKGKLAVHHTVNWKKTRDDGVDNLITLCHSCHIKLHFRERRVEKGAG